MAHQVDPLAALKLWAVEVELAGQVFVVPARPAADWLVAILGDEALPLIPGMMIENDEETVLDLLLNGDIDAELIAQRSRELLAVVGGRPWWEADRLIRSAGAHWDVIGGELARLGVNLDKISLAAVLNAIYAICTRTMDEKQRNKFDIELRMPPLGVDVEELYDQQVAESAFLALMAQAQPPAP